MITPSFSPTATERVLPKLALDFTTASLDSRITFTRALNTATCVNSSGNVAVVNADLPRFDYNPTTLSCNGLLIEESRVNSIRNNTMQDAVAGTPGTMPTNWSTHTPLTGLTRQIVGTGTENGIAYIDIKLSGTPSGAGAYYVFFETNTGVTAATGQSWAISSYLKLAAGSLTGITSFNLEMDELTSVGGFVKLNRGSNIAPTTASLISQRNTYAVALSGGATTARVQPIIILILNGAAIDVTFRIGLPQLEAGAFTTSVIPTTTTALTRNADVATMTGTNFSDWYNATEGTMVVQGYSYSDSSTSLFPVFASIDDGTLNNRSTIFGRTFDDLALGQVRVSGVLQAGLVSTTLVSYTAANKISLSYETNKFASSLNGYTPATDLSGTIPTVNRLSFNPSAVYNNALNGYLQKFNYYSQALTNAEVQAFTK